MTRAVKVLVRFQDRVSAELVNPGSIWHPELCARACIYFHSGRCDYGSRMAWITRAVGSCGVVSTERERERVRRALKNSAETGNTST